MLMPSTRNLVITGAFVAVCGLGIAGWARKNNRPVENTLMNPAANSSSMYTSNGQYDAQSQSASAQYSGSDTRYTVSGPVPQPVYSTDGYYPSRVRPVYVRQGEVLQPVIEQAPPQRIYQEQSAPRRTYQTQEHYTDSRGHRRGRTKTHSVEIVAGTAAAGAVIGALAGGGKGAAIGGASGAGAGFIYDRLTHNK
jgi:hypothetical protein